MIVGPVKLVVFIMLTFPLPAEAAVMPPEPVMVPKPPVSVLVAENATEPPAAALSVTLPVVARVIVPEKLEPPAAASAVVPPRVVGPAVALTVIGRSISNAPPVTRAAGLPAELASPIVIGLVAMPNGLG